jgi:hypothetical protein
MVHPVKIEAFTPGGKKQGRVSFTLDGVRYNACFEGDSAEARELLTHGATYPLALTIAAQCKVDYAEPGTPGLTVEKSDATGDTISFLGRTWQTLDMATVLLQTQPQVALRLEAPQFATDFRGGSWLTGKGVLCAALPEDHHD